MHDRPRGLVPSLALAASLLVAGCHPSRGAAPEGPSTADEVNVGYGTQKGGDITGSVSSLTAEDMERMQVADMERVLTGRVPGLQVIRRGGEVTLRIRGGGEPHVVIDGLPSTTRDLLALTPETIARIDVRKDAGAAIYGSRGANGVILVTTKRAR